MVLTLTLHTAGLPGELSTEQGPVQTQVPSPNTVAPILGLYTGVQREIPLEPEPRCLKIVILMEVLACWGRRLLPRERKRIPTGHTVSRMAGPSEAPRL